MALRKIVRIDEGLCDGCGQCIKACPEGALRIIEGKARMVDEARCDGLGACIGYCPKGAIIMEERTARPFLRILSQSGRVVTPQVLFNGSREPILQSSEPSQGSSLPNWPIQLRLMPIRAPFYDDKELLLAADCVPVAYRGMHTSLMTGRTVVIGCPKFDDPRGYAEKIGEILKWNKISGITLVHMEVPCCRGLSWAIDRAVEASGKNLPIKRLTVTINGELREERT